MNVTDVPGYGPYGDWTPNRWSGGLWGLKYIVLHTTEGGLYNGGDGALSSMMNPAAAASAHMLVKTDGSVIRLAPDGDSCWHAGFTYAPSAQCFYDAGQANPNSVSRGIENAGYATDPLTSAQYASNAGVIAQWFLGAGGPVPVIGHFELATGGANYRSDPGLVNYAAILAAIGGGGVPVGYADIEEQVKGTIRVMVSQDGTTRDAMKDVYREMAQSEEGSALTEFSIRYPGGYASKLQAWMDAHIALKALRGRLAAKKGAAGDPFGPIAEPALSRSHERAHTDQRGPEGSAPAKPEGWL